MKVLAINSSPRMERGNTALILEPFLEGLREGGADVELFYARKLKIAPCLGCFSCWTKTPGECIQRDDMEMLLFKMGQADVLVLATPVYCDGITGPLKNLLDRSIPLALPFFELREGHCRHPIRVRTARSMLVLVSNCGFWEMDNFDPLIVHMEAFCKNASLDFAGALLRPHGGGLRSMMERGLPLDDIFEAAKDAGRQLATLGSISPETLKVVSRELIPRETYFRHVNQGFQEALDKLTK
jgi:multimeric flavodoxin WrbA